MTYKKSKKDHVTNIFLSPKSANDIVKFEPKSVDGELVCPVDRILVLNLALLNCYLDITFGKKTPCAH